MESPPKNATTRTIALGFVLCFFWTLVWFFTLRWANLEEKLWVTILFSICVFPSLAYVGGHKFRVPLMPMWGIGYFAMFGMPVITMDRAQSISLYNQTQNAVADALRLAVLGGIACLAAAYTALGAWAEHMAPRWRLPWDPRRAGRMGVVLISTGLGAYYYKLVSQPPAGFRQFLFIVSQLSTIGMLTLFLLQLRNCLSARFKLFLWGFAVPIQFLLALGTGAIWEIVRSLSPLLFCFAAERRRIPWVALLAFSLLLIPFLGTKHEYRSYTWGNEELAEIYFSDNALQKGLAFIKLTFLRLKEGGVETYTVAAETAESRVNHLELLILLREMTPSFVPFWNGETYASLPWMFVPRLLYPAKPSKNIGNEFGHRYYILDQDDDTTSINLPHQVVEMYINFGVFGIFIGMGFVGLIYRAALVFLSRPESGERGMIIGCALLTNLLSLDGDFSLVFGGLIYYVLLMIFFTRFFQPRLNTVPT